MFLTENSIQDIFLTGNLKNSALAEEFHKQLHEKYKIQVFVSYYCEETQNSLTLLVRTDELFVFLKTIIYHFTTMKWQNRFSGFFIRLWNDIQFRITGYYRENKPERNIMMEYFRSLQLFRSSHLMQSASGISR